MEYATTTIQKCFNTLLHISYWTWRKHIASYMSTEEHRTFIWKFIKDIHWPHIRPHRREINRCRGFYKLPLYLRNWWWRTWNSSRRSSTSPAFLWSTTQTLSSCLKKDYYYLKHTYKHTEERSVGLYNHSCLLWYYHTAGWNAWFSRIICRYFIPR